MRDNIKNIAVTVLFIIVIFGFMVGNIIMPDAVISYSERRTLTQMPKFSQKALLDGDFFKKFEEYALDQFVFREKFRGLKAFVNFNILKQKDNNGIYIVNGFISNLDYPLNEKSVLNAANKISGIYNKFLKNINTSYSIIPDKNFFLASDNDYLSIDYNKMIEIMGKNISDVKYIDIIESLSIDDYYRTDVHWSQDRLIDTADKLLNEMENDKKASDNNYTQKELYPFYGSFFGQAAVSIEPDTLIYLTNNTLENAKVFDHYYNVYGSIYEPERFDGVDPYDVFLSGQKPLITIENPDASVNKGLLLFKDSFGNSIAPLLLNGYSKITLIDLRLVSSDALGDLIDFSEYQDAMFLYCTQTLNNSYMLR